MKISYFWSQNPQLSFIIFFRTSSTKSVIFLRPASPIFFSPTFFFSHSSQDRRLVYFPFLSWIFLCQGTMVKDHYKTLMGHKPLPLSHCFENVRKNTSKGITWPLNYSERIFCYKKDPNLFLTERHCLNSYFESGAALHCTECITDLYLGKVVRWLFLCLFRHFLSK